LIEVDPLLRGRDRIERRIAILRCDALGKEMFREVLQKIIVDRWWRRRLAGIPLAVKAARIAVSEMS
jgi:hypothetical protein